MTTYRDMPINFRRFIWLWVASAAVTLVYVPFTPTPVGATHLATVLVDTVIFLAVDAILFVLVWFAAWRRRNWARWGLLVVLILSLLSLFWTPSSYYQQHPLLLGTTLISTILEIAALYFIFTGNSRQWFETRTLG